MTDHDDSSTIATIANANDRNVWMVATDPILASRPTRLGTPTHGHPTLLGTPIKTPPNQVADHDAESRRSQRNTSHWRANRPPGEGSPGVVRVPGDSISTPGTACETASKHLDRSDPQGGHCEHETRTNAEESGL